MDLNELCRNLLKNSSKFIAKDIQNKYHREIFLNTIDNIVYSFYFENLFDLKTFSTEKIFFLEEKMKWYWKKSSDRAELDAYYLVLDVCNSLIKRFLDGGEGTTYLIKH